MTISFPYLVPQLSISEALLWIGVNKSWGFFSPKVPVEGYGISLGSVGCQHLSYHRLIQVAKAKFSWSVWLRGQRLTFSTQPPLIGQKAFLEATGQKRWVSDCPFPSLLKGRGSRSVEAAEVQWLRFPSSTRFVMRI